jgi:hypothetical protein
MGHLILILPVLNQSIYVQFYPEFAAIICRFKQKYIFYVYNHPTIQKPETRSYTISA